jgi:hypothetical protein
VGPESVVRVRDILGGRETGHVLPLEPWLKVSTESRVRGVINDSFDV